MKLPRIMLTDLKFKEDITQKKSKDKEEEE